MYSTRTLFLLALSLAVSFTRAQQKINYVNPFIGTEKSDVFTRWGSEGGTYPGAVAPAGYIQLTPETSVQEPYGYYYNDSAIYQFSCLNHKSGFPSGSAGQLYIMPVINPVTFQLKTTKRGYAHANESAMPGYYRVQFTDNNTKAEATTSARCGMFRFSFPPGVLPCIFIGGAGKLENKNNNKVYGSKHHSVVLFDRPFTSVQANDSGKLYTFKQLKGGTSILLKLSASPAGFSSAERNLEVETANKSFDKIRQQNAAGWERLLSVADIEDDNEKNKTIFYTALYHSLLIPWIVSDVDGKYLGRDKKVHITTGKAQYSGFSPWDTFRSLHPLLTLLYADKQKDVLLSLLDIYKQSGNLPVETMTGNHAISIIVDSYLKGIMADSALVYNAIKSNVFTGPFTKKDMRTYIEQQYVPFTRPESVTRTTEYAYDDWCVAQYAKYVMHNEKEYTYFNTRGYNYKSLFHSNSLFLLPRNGNEFKIEPGNTGYKEGDKWIYTYFVPHQARNLVNLLGGDDHFVQRLDSALTHSIISFDNETVFHIPYFFSYANHYTLTQKWINQIAQKRYNNTPGGLPGNDDLGSVSSWYIFSAMGLYPFCPGNPTYTAGVPQFKLIKLRLPNGEQLVIRKKGSGDFVKAVYFNGQRLQQPAVEHALLIKGGELLFEMNQAISEDVFVRAPANSNDNPVIVITDIVPGKSEVLPDEEIVLYFNLRNSGAEGTRIGRLFVDGKPGSKKYSWVKKGEALKDSITFRLYTYGTHAINIDSSTRVYITVVNNGNPDTMAHVERLVVEPVIAAGTMQHIQYTAKNTGGAPRHFNVPVLVNGSLMLTDTVTLHPGEEKSIQSTFLPAGPGLQTVTVANMSEKFKIMEGPLSSVVLDLSLAKLTDDVSGFGNQATMHGNCPVKDSLPLLGKACTIEMASSASLDKMGQSITMMAWIYTTGGDSGQVDILAKGDHHVIQVYKNRMLKFFAGGWARGECDAKLPAGWKNKWHHVAGTCDGKVLRVYIDGKLQTVTPLNSISDLSAPGVWHIGSNEEFPAERNFEGYISKVKIFAAALTPEAINMQMELGH